MYKRIMLAVEADRIVWRFVNTLEWLKTVHLLRHKL